MLSLRRPRLAIGIVAAGLALTLTGCAAEAAPAEESAASVTIETNNGPMEVPVEPLRVAALDNTSFATLQAFGVEPVVLPKPLLPGEGFDEWESDAEILDAGTHREPDLEAVSEAAPDVIIGGGRFADFTDELQKIAPVVDVSPSDESEDGFVEGLKTQTTALGAIFNKTDEAEALIAALNDAIEAAAAATDGESVFLANVSGGKIDNGAGRIGRLLEPLTLKDVFASEDLDSESVHVDSGIAPETIAQANPEWMIVLDRDAATADGEATPAKQIVDAQEAFANTTFVTNDQIIYLDSYFYVTEGIQAYTDAFESIASAFTAA
jgi:iron complex transport system substrate-binding protein